MDRLAEIGDKLTKILEITGGSVSVPEAVTIMKIFNYRECEIRPAFWLAANSSPVVVDSSFRMSHRAPKI